MNSDESSRLHLMPLHRDWCFGRMGRGLYRLGEGGGGAEFEFRAIRSIRLAGGDSGKERWDLREIGERDEIEAGGGWKRFWLKGSEWSAEGLVGVGSAGISAC